MIMSFSCFLPYNMYISLYSIYLSEHSELLFYLILFRSAFLCFISFCSCVPAQCFGFRFSSFEFAFFDFVSIRLFRYIPLFSIFSLVNHSSYFLCFSDPALVPVSCFRRFSLWSLLLFETYFFPVYITLANTQVTHDTHTLYFHLHLHFHFQVGFSFLLCAKKLPLLE